MVQVEPSGRSPHKVESLVRIVTEPLLLPRQYLIDAASDAAAWIRWARAKLAEAERTGDTRAIGFAREF